MNARAPNARQAAPIDVQRWFWRVIGYGLLTIASSAWLVCNEQPFWPAFAIQSLASAVFVALIIGAVIVGIMIGMWVGKLNGFLGFIVGVVAAAGLFFVIGISSTMIPVLGPAIERVVSQIE